MIDTIQRSSHLFNSRNKDVKEYGEVLQDIQAYMSKQHADLFMGAVSEEKEQLIRKYIHYYIAEQHIAVKEMDEEQLADALYKEMAEYSFLTAYLKRDDVEEINVNAWNDIEVQYSDGRYEKLQETFASPQHAINVMRRMLHISGMVLDNSSPAILGHLSKNIRIAVLKTPIVDEDVGVTASIRIVNPKKLSEEDFILNHTAIKEELDLLRILLRYGISICVAGSTNSGKTTLSGWMLSTLPDQKRIFTIEDGSRELSAVKKDDGRIKNSVIHTITRKSENEKMDIDQESLLDVSLRYNPDVICVGEMRSSEAYTAQEAARTGHTVLTTIHSNSCEATYRRMVTLCKRKYDIDDETLFDLVTEAFPVIVFVKQLENKERKIMEIMECCIHPDGKREFHTLYQYQITSNEIKDGRYVIQGAHMKVQDISSGLAKRLRENGIPHELLMSLMEKEGEVS